LSVIDQIVVHTVGHSTHEAARFVELLNSHGIELLCDIRRFPSSRRFPHFNAAQLEPTLAQAGIDYVHVPELGGRRQPMPGSRNSGWKVRQFQGYADHMESEEFRAGLEELLRMARHRRTAAMCAEAGWWRCHRRLLSDALLVRGFDVVHIGARGESERHELTPFAVVAGGELGYPRAQGQLEV
jgi:uncharacterized protein (DUF488 family)